MNQPDGVAAAALNALNLNWSQIGAALNLPKNQPIQIRVVTTKIPPEQQCLSLAPSAGGVALAARPIRPNPLSYASGAPLRTFSNLQKQRERAIAVLPPAQRFVAPNGATRVASFSVLQTPQTSMTPVSTEETVALFPITRSPERNILNEHLMKPDRNSPDQRSATSTPSTVSQSEYSKSRENSPEPFVNKPSSQFPVYGPPDTAGAPPKKKICLQKIYHSVHKDGMACTNTHFTNGTSKHPAERPYLHVPCSTKMQKSVPLFQKFGSDRVKAEPQTEISSHAKLYGKKNSQQLYSQYIPRLKLELKSEQPESPVTAIQYIGSTNQKEFIDQYRYNERNSSCARVRPYLPKAERPKQDLPNPKPRYRISPTHKQTRKEALAHFDQIASEIAKDKEAAIPTLNDFLSAQKVKMEVETHRAGAAVTSLMNKYCTGFGVSPKPRSAKVKIREKKSAALPKFGKPKLTPGIGKKRKKTEESSWATGMTCARVRPIPSTFVCARCRPYQGLRKEFHWYYFMMHPERTVSYVPKKGHRVELSDPLVGKGRNAAGSADLPLPIQYRFYLQRATKIFLGKSPIHGIGVFTSEDVDRNRLVLEYRGQVIRNVLTNSREANYRRRGLGTYMFSLDDDFTVDATLQGSVARFINHSCEPNCAAKVIAYEGKKKIVLYTTRNVEKGEELCYNYKLPLEQEKLPCLCNKPSCRKFLN